MASSPSSDEGEGAGPAPAPCKVRYCAVYDCTNNHKTHPHLSYFGFPSDKDKVKEWAKKIRRPDIIQANGRVSNYYRICEEHFLPRHINFNRKRRRLVKSAVPARKLPHQGPYVHVTDVATPPQLQVKGKTLARSTLEVWEYVERAPKPKTKKKKKIVHQPPPLAPQPALKGFFSNCDRHLTPNTAEFVKLVARLQTARGSNDFCIKLLHTNPQAYHLLQASLGLPPVSALHRHCAPYLPDFLTAVELLKTKADKMTDIEKHCTLSVDFIDARMLLYYNITFDRIVGLHEVDGTHKPRVATRAAIATAKGLLTNWKQPVALCYLAGGDEAFNPWIDKIIHRLHTIGVKVHALVCDPIAPAPSREISHDQPFFFVGDSKIYLLYDPPRLMKKLLCDFMGYDFYFDKGIAKWNDVLEYWKTERKKPLTLTPELTDASIKLATVHRMKPQQAARILSRGVGTALTDRVAQGLLSDNARTTASFIIKLNNLYDLLNSNTMKTSSEFKKGLTQDPNQTGFLAYMKSFFKSIKLKDSYGLDKVATKRLSDNWQVTIAAVLGLQKDLQPVRPYLLTQNLHLDDSVAKNAQRIAGSPSSLEPTCQQIFTAFKKQFFHEMLQSGQVNIDLNSLLARVLSEAPTGTQIDSMEVDDDIQISASDYRRLRLPKKHTFLSAAKHLLSVASRVHGNCSLAAEYMNAPPEPDFLQLVQDLDEALRSALSEESRAGGFLRDLLLDVHVLDCALPCECFPLDYLKRLFFRLRLYSLLRHNQKRLKNGEVDLEINSLE